MAKVRNPRFQGLFGVEQSYSLRLRVLRKRMGVTSDQVRDVLGWSRRKFQAMEAGTYRGKGGVPHPWTVPELVAACRAIGVSPALLFLNSVWK